VNVNGIYRNSSTIGEFLEILEMLVNLATPAILKNWGSRGFLKFFRFFEDF
jgi:hypothetical protein